MVHIEHETAKQLASDITSAHLAIDQALADLATLTSSVINACRHSDASLAQSQAAIEGAAVGAFALWAMHGPTMGQPLPCPPVSKPASLSCRQMPLGSDCRSWIFIFP
jgi:hypothetical protein